MLINTATANLSMNDDDDDDHDVLENLNPNSKKHIEKHLIFSGFLEKR